MSDKEKMKDNILNIIESLQPGDEYNDNAMFYYWMDYACELDSLALEVYGDQGKAYCEKRLQSLADGSPEHDALTDVMLTIQQNNYTLA